MPRRLLVFACVREELDARTVGCIVPDDDAPAPSRDPGRGMRAHALLPLSVPAPPARARSHG